MEGWMEGLAWRPARPARAGSRQSVPARPRPRRRIESRIGPRHADVAENRAQQRNDLGFENLTLHPSGKRDFVV